MLRRMSQPVSIDVKNTSLEDVLSVCFKDQPLTYVIDNNVIVVQVKDNPEPTADVSA